MVIFRKEIFELSFVHLWIPGKNDRYFERILNFLSVRESYVVIEIFESYLWYTISFQQDWAISTRLRDNSGCERAYSKFETCSARFISFACAFKTALNFTDCWCWTTHENIVILAQDKVSETRDQLPSS